MRADTSELLKNNDLKTTRQRIMVLDEITSQDAAVSQPELEKKLGKEINRVTLYRILNIYEDKGILHKIVGLNGTTNYAVCSSNCSEHNHKDEHLHFNCTSCEKVYCMNVSIPPVKIPSGFDADAINLIAYGTCKNCKKIKC